MSTVTTALVSIEKYRRGSKQYYVLLVTVDHYVTLRFQLGEDHPDNEELRTALANIPVRNE